MSGNAHRLTLAGGGSAPASGRLWVDGRYFVDPVGALVIRRSITAFTLAKRFATGQIDQALRYLDTVARLGFTEVRVFSHVDWTGPPTAGVESGWAYDEVACSRAIEAAAERGLRVELVAHTYNYGLEDMVAHLRRVDALCVAYPTILLEIANEPSRNDIPIEAILRRYQPLTPGWASGQATPVPLPQPALTYHSPRKYEWSRCFKDAWEFGAGTGPETSFSPGFPGPVMLDEPPQVEQTIRDHGSAVAVDDWRAYGAGAAFFAAGATMHGNPDFQQCVVPGDPAVVACLQAFIAGFQDVPLQRYSGYSGALSPPSADPGSRRYQRQGEDGRTYEITVRPYGFRAV